MDTRNSNRSIYLTRSLCSKIENRFKQEQTIYDISKKMNIPVKQVRDIACFKKFIVHRLESFCKTHYGKKVVVFDLETSGLPITPQFGQFYKYTENRFYDSSRIIQIAFSSFYLGEDDIEDIQVHSFYRKPEQFELSDESIQVHHITRECLDKKGKSLSEILQSSQIIQLFNEADFIIAHNIMFDINIFKNELYRLNIPIPEEWNRKITCTCRMTDYTRLGTLYSSLFNKEGTNLHDASGDVWVLVEILQKLANR